MLSRRGLLIAALALLTSPAQAQMCPRQGFCNPPTVSTVSGGDPYWTNVKLLLSFDSGFTDESSAAHGASAIIGSPIIRSTFSVFGGSSAYFNGTSSISFPDSNDWNFSTRKFTIEFWYRQSSTGAANIVGQWSGSGSDNGWIVNSSTFFNFDVSTTGVNDILAVGTGSIMAANTWYAVCVDFDGAKYRAYVDGAMRGTSSNLQSIRNSSLGLVFGGGSGNKPYTGYIDEFRLTMDVARYASDSGYTVTTQPFPRR